MDPLIGQVLADRYRVVRALGQGGMGAVYEALQIDLNRRVAIKLLRPELADDPACIERFRREAITAAGLLHPNIPRVHDFVPTPGALLIVMEMLQGRTLLDVVREGRMPTPRACAIAGQLASALAVAHDAGVIHRDLKPGNVILVPVVGGELAMLLDFGIAKLKESDGYKRLTATGMTVGTPRYGSPEQLLGKRDIDGRSDLFSLGVLLYCMTTGKPPFTSSGAQLLIDVQTKEPLEMSAHAPDLPPALIEIVRRAMRKDPAQRFASAREMGAALEPFLALRAEPASARAATPVHVTSSVTTVAGPAIARPPTQAPTPLTAAPTRVPSWQPTSQVTHVPPAKPKRWGIGCALIGLGAGALAIVAIAGVIVAIVVGLRSMTDQERFEAGNDIGDVGRSLMLAPLDVEIRDARAHRGADGDWIVLAQILITNGGAGEIIVIREDVTADEMTPYPDLATLPITTRLPPGQSILGIVAFRYPGRLQPPRAVTLRLGTNTRRAELAVD